MRPSGTGSAASGPVVGLLGVIGTDDLARDLAAQVVAAELGRRMPTATFRVFSPTAATGSQQRRDPDVEPLGEWGDASTARLAALVDVTVAVGPDLGDAPGASHASSGGRADAVRLAASRRYLVGGLGVAAGVPHAWAAVGVPAEPGPEFAGLLTTAVDGLLVAGVATAGDAQRLAQFGIRDRIHVVGDPLVVADRLVTDEFLADRRAMLQLLDLLPEGAYRVVAVHRADEVDEVVAAVVGADAGGALPLVVVDTDAGEVGRTLVLRLEAALGRHVRRVPAVAGALDLVAAIAGAADHVAEPAPVRTLCDVFRVPAAGTTGAPAVDADTVLRARRARIDAHFDELAAAIRAALEAAPHAHADRIARLASDLDASRARAEALQERLLHERRVLAAAMRQRQAELERRTLEAEAQVAALLGSRTFRWTAAARSARRLLRRRSPS
jgi:hypothetical protein